MVLISLRMNERTIHHFWMLLRRFSLRLDVLRNRTAISLRFKNEAFTIFGRLQESKLAAIFATFGCFEEAYSDFVTL